MTGASAGGGASSLIGSGPYRDADAERPRVLLHAGGGGRARGPDAGEVQRGPSAGEQGAGAERVARLVHLGRRTESAAGGDRSHVEGERPPPRAAAELNGATPEAGPEHVGADAG